MSKFIMQFLRQAICVFCLINLAGCSDNDKGPTKPTAPDLAAERSAIESAYRAWSQAQIAQNYSQAISYTAPGGNGYNMVVMAKSYWDDGWQYYFDIQYIEAWLDAEDLGNAYGEAVGNVRFYQYKPSEGAQTTYHGLYSSCRKLNGKWKIDGVNINLDQDWWR